MKKLFLCAATLALLTVANTALASCLVTVSAPADGHDRIVVHGDVDGAVEAALSGWNTCPQVDDLTLPRFSTTGAGYSLQVTLTPHAGCSALSSFGSSSGSTEILTNGDDCTKQLMAHELGHAVGLDDSPDCPTNYLMKVVANPPGLVNPASEECSTAEAQTETRHEQQVQEGNDGPCSPRIEKPRVVGVREHVPPCQVSPILLDIGGRNGIWTTGVENPVVFDIDADQLDELITWSAPGRGQAFLVLDLSGNGAIDDGAELFGDSTLITEDLHADHGFEALAQYDRLANGGNANGTIDRGDAVWSRLQLWSDIDHDARSQRRELSDLEDHEIVALELEYVEVDAHDPMGNWHRFRGYFHKRTKVRGRWVVTRELMEDVFFQLVFDDE